MTNKSNPDDAFKVLRLLLQVSGNWPKVDATYFYNLKAVINFVWITSFTILGVVEIYFGYEGIASISHPVFLNSEAISYLPKLVLFHYKKPAFFRILECIHQPVLMSYDDDLDVYIQRKIKLFTILSLSFHTLCWITLTSVALMPFFARTFVKILPMPFPFDLTEQPLIYYILFWLYQLLIMNMSATVNISFDILACCFMGITSAHLEILREQLKRIADTLPDENTSASKKQYLDAYGKNDREVLRKLKQCVEYHNAIEKLVKAVDDTFNVMFLIQFGSSVIVICLTSFSFILHPIASVKFIVAFLFFACVFIQLTIYCAFGNDVIIQGSKIGEACYVSEWVRCGPAVRRSLFIIMERAKRPYEFTAGKFITISLTSFLTIVKSSFSYLTVLKTMYGKSAQNEENF